MLVREVPIPKRLPIRVWVAGLAIAGVVAAVVLPEVLGYDYMTACTKPEESLQLNKIGKAAKGYFIEHGQFPIGRTQALPPWSCCPGACGAVPVQAWMADPIWSALEFDLDGMASQVHYRYESRDGKTFRATAIRDAKCDGVLTTFVLEGEIAKDGGPTVRLTEPRAP